MSIEAEKSTTISAALREAEAIIEGAKQRAQEILKEAADSHAAAHQEGFDKGFNEAQEQVARLAIRLISEQDKLNLLLSKKAAQLALAIAETVIEEELKIEPSLVVNIANKALREAVIGDEVKLFVSEQDRPAIEQRIAALKQTVNSSKLSIVVDPELRAGSCRVTTAVGEVDASVNHFLSLIKENLGV
ncbi:MAG: hypothetical protein IT292_00800 [Deltaproteobacteria bacterium]|nr:hypothetical protein [Deltaproteobacteria bacterium]